MLLFWATSPFIFLFFFLLLVHHPSIAVDPYTLYCCWQGKSVWFPVLVSLLPARPLTGIAISGTQFHRKKARHWTVANPGYIYVSAYYCTSWDDILVCLGQFSLKEFFFFKWSLQNKYFQTCRFNWFYLNIVIGYDGGGMKFYYNRCVEIGAKFATSN